VVAVQIGICPVLYGQQSHVTITVVEGEAAMNNVRLRAPHQIAVRVTGDDSHPVAGAAVTFTAPAQGASGRFFNGEPSLTTVTDATGIAVAKGFRPNELIGKFEIRVVASSAGDTAHAAVTQFNMDVPAQAAKKSGGHGKTIAIVIAVAGAAAAGLAVALSQSKGSSSSAVATPAPIGITTAAGTVGPPQ
jgi:hypothetical protein